MIVALRKAAETQKVQADKKWSPQIPFQVGKKEYLSTKYLCLKVPCHKLAPKFLGLFPIVHVLNPVIVELKLPHLLGRIHLVFHSNLLRHVETMEVRDPLKHETGAIQVGGEAHYEVEQILDSCIHRGPYNTWYNGRGIPCERHLG